MPNCADNRLTLTGPADEIARFMRECIRIRPDDDPNDGPSLDLDALVPMPPEILATCDGATDELRAIACAATGFTGWYDWCVAHWGTKWNVAEFRGRLIGDTIYDCSFLTAWSCPVPALSALAAQYPLLRGTVAASEPDNDWSLIAAFSEGDYVSAECSYDPQMQLLVRGGWLSEPLCGFSVEAMLSVGADAADLIWAQAALGIDRFGQLVGGTLPRRLAFERTVRDLCDLLATSSKEDALDSDLARACESREHAAFLLNHDRMRTQIDRELVRTLAACLRGDAVWGGDDGDDHRDEIEFEVLDSFETEALHDWACVAMYRPGAMLNWTSEEALRASFFAYADQLRHDILIHLGGSAGQSNRPLPAVA